MCNRARCYTIARNSIESVNQVIIEGLKSCVTGLGATPYLVHWSLQNTEPMC